jgi:hypothetical protein
MGPAQQRIQDRGGRLDRLTPLFRSGDCGRAHASYLADGQATVAPLAVLGRAEPEAAVNCTNAAITIAPLVMSVCPISRPSKDLSVLPLLFKAGRTIPAVTSNEGNLDVAGLSHFEGLA